jgi:hypothetical protein
MVVVVIVIFGFPSTVWGVVVKWLLVVEIAERASTYSAVESSWTGGGLGRVVGKVKLLVTTSGGVGGGSSVRVGAEKGRLGHATVIEVSMWVLGERGWTVWTNVTEIGRRVVGRSGEVVLRVRSTEGLKVRGDWV